jgi:hypothetical protein
MNLHCGNAVIGAHMGDCGLPYELGKVSDFPTITWITGRQLSTLPQCLRRYFYSKTKRSERRGVITEIIDFIRTVFYSLTTSVASLRIVSELKTERCSDFIGIRTQHFSTTLIS